MSQNSSVSIEYKKARPYRWWLAVALPIWLLAGFTAVSFFEQGLILLLKQAGVTFVGINMSVLSAVVAALVYILTLAVVLGMPWWIKRRRTTREDLGITGLPTWADIGLAPAGFVIYVLVSVVAIYVIQQLFSGFNVSQMQDVGFENLSQSYEYILAFITLVVIAPLAEELLFRGFLYGKLRRAVPVWVAMLVTSALFGAVHGQWNVAIDVFILSMIACSLREVTGSIWAGILLHMIKNGLAFYILFINTSFLIQ